MSKAEIKVILILFHNSSYCYLKHYYVNHVCEHLRHLFPEVVSYNRFVELEKTVALLLGLFIKKVLLGVISTYCFFPKKQYICVERTIDDQLTFSKFIELTLDYLKTLYAEYEEWDTDSGSLICPLFPSGNYHRGTRANQFCHSKIYPCLCITKK